MAIKNLNIKGFRNLKPIKLSFTEDNKAHAFVGANGQGKTNVLEAIYLCSLSKSFRTKSSSDLVGFDQDFTSIKCETGDKQLEVIVTSKPKRKVLKVNGVKRTAADFVGIFKAVFFSPDDLANMSFSPGLRRRYMDIVLTQLNHDYLEVLMRYKEACKQRNALLKKIREREAEESELDFWDGVISEQGIIIIKKRIELIERLEKMVNKHYQAISSSDDKIQVSYLSEVHDIHNENEFFELIRRNHQRDILVGETRLGPHRDDLLFSLNAHDMGVFASRGEWRSLVLSLKLAEIDLIKEKTGESPVLLLDDVFSELDAKRQKYLFEATGSSQTFVTTTHMEFIDVLPRRPKIYMVKEGIVS